MPPSCALLGGFAIGARVALLLATLETCVRAQRQSATPTARRTHYARRRRLPAPVRKSTRLLRARRYLRRGRSISSTLRGDGVVTRTRNVSEYMLVLLLCLVGHSGHSGQWSVVSSTNLGHVHVVNEVDEFLVARRSVVASGLLLERLLQDSLQHLRGGVEVERHVGDGVVVAELRQPVVDDHRLAESGVADQHHRTLDLDQHVHEEPDACRLVRVDQRRLHQHRTAILTVCSSAPNLYNIKRGKLSMMCVVLWLGHRRSGSA